jgi:hypothetical protein
MVTFAIGVLSLFTAISTVLLPLAMAAIAVGVVAVWRLSRDESAVGGWMAQLGLALAVASVVWSLSATQSNNQYLHTQGGEFAEIFLDTLANGNRYDALELLRVESERQIPGTNLREFYRQSGDLQDEANAFLDTVLAKEVIASGPNAKWEFVRGGDVTANGKTVYVTVEMINRAAPEQGLLVYLRRQVGLVTKQEDSASKAWWNVQQLLPRS